MKKYLLLSLILCVCSTGISRNVSEGPESGQTVIHGYGDLYVLHNTDKSVRIVAAKANGSVVDTTIASLPDNLKFRYHSEGEDTNVSFEFKLHNRIKHSWRMEKPEKTLVVSDLHGRLDAFIAILKGNKVVDDKLNWIYGKNQLIFLGDILDRGRDDNGIAWLVYKLEQEAEDAGGRLDFIIGNHEDLDLKDDIRYVNEAHLIFSARAGIAYSELYGKNTELGRWFRDKYIVLIVGDNLFVHAGLSPKIIHENYNTGEINELAWRYIGYPNKERNLIHSRNETLFGSNGPLWYRGLVTESSPIFSEELDKVLDYYKAGRIVVGHSEVDEIDWRYGGRVVAINVRHRQNFPENRTAGILIEGNLIYSVTYSGSKTRLGESALPK